MLLLSTVVRSDETTVDLPSGLRLQRGEKGRKEKEKGENYPG